MSDTENESIILSDDDSDFDHISVDHTDIYDEENTKPLDFTDKVLYVKDLYSKVYNTEKRRWTNKFYSIIKFLDDSNNHNMVPERIHKLVHAAKVIDNEDKYTARKVNNVFSDTFSPYITIENNSTTELSLTQDMLVIDENDNKSVNRLLSKTDDYKFITKGVANIVDYNNSELITFDFDDYINKLDELKINDEITVTFANTYRSIEATVSEINNGDISFIINDEEYTTNIIDMKQILIFPKGFVSFSKKHLLKTNIALLSSADNIPRLHNILNIDENEFLMIKLKSGEKYNNLIKDLSHVQNEIIEEYSNQYEKQVKKQRVKTFKGKQSIPKWMKEVPIQESIKKNKYKDFKIEAANVKRTSNTLDKIVWNYKDLSKDKSYLAVFHRKYNSGKFVYVSNYRVFKMKHDKTKWIISEDVTDIVHKEKHTYPDISKYNTEYFDFVKHFRKPSAFIWNYKSPSIQKATSYEEHTKEIIGDDNNDSFIPEQGIVFNEIDVSNNSDDLSDDLVYSILNKFNITLGEAQINFIKHETQQYEGFNKAILIIAFIIIFAQIAYPAHIVGNKYASIDNVMKSPGELVYLHEWYNQLLDMIEGDDNIDLGKFIKTIKKAYTNISRDETIKKVLKKKLDTYNNKIKYIPELISKYSLWDQFRPNKPIDKSQHQHIHVKKVLKVNNTNLRYSITIPAVEINNIEFMPLLEKFRSYLNLQNDVNFGSSEEQKINMSRAIDNDSNMVDIIDFEKRLLCDAFYVCKKALSIDIPMINENDIKLYEDIYVIKYVIHKMLGMMDNVILENVLEEIEFKRKMFELSITTARQKYEIIREQKKVKDMEKWKGLPDDLRYIAKELVDKLKDKSIIDDLNILKNEDEYMIEDDDCEEECGYMD
jgi:hypothetical protein